MRTVPGSDPVLLHGLKIDFLSPVTKPDVEGAVALLLKRAGYEHEVEDSAHPPRKKRRKGAKAFNETAARSACEDHGHFAQLEKFDEDDGIVVMTDSVDGHAHLIYIRARAGTTTWQLSADSDSGHDHPWMLTLDESGVFALMIGDADGHTHGIDSRALNAAFATAALGKLFDPEDAMAKKTEAEVQKLEDDLVLARLFGGLTDAERIYFAGLGEDVDKVAFMKLESPARLVLIEKASTADPVIYKSESTGAEFRASDDPRMILMAKQGDADRARNEKLAGLLEDAALEKRADVVLDGLPGTTASKVATLKALEAIADEPTRKLAMAGIRAGGLAISKGFETLGSIEAMKELGLEAADVGGDPDAALDALAQAHAKESGLSVTKSYDVVTRTAEGRELYAQIQKRTLDATPAGGAALN